MQLASNPNKPNNKSDDHNNDNNKDGFEKKEEGIPGNN